MRGNVVDVVQHYDLMAAEMEDPSHPVCDPFEDPPGLREWMGQADGPTFFAALGPVRGKRLLEVGVGTGRVAKKVLDLGCAHLTGIDVSAPTLERAGRNLTAYSNVELVAADAGAFCRPEAFDAAFSVWAFFHIRDQQRALRNVVASLKPGGRLVLSLERVDEWLDYGSRVIRQFPVEPDQCASWLRDLGCQVEEPVRVWDAHSPRAAGEPVLYSTVVGASKPT